MDIKERIFSKYVDMVKKDIDFCDNECKHLPTILTEKEFHENRKKIELYENHRVFTKHFYMKGYSI